MADTSTRTSPTARPTPPSGGEGTVVGVIAELRGTEAVVHLDRDCSQAVRSGEFLGISAPGSFLIGQVGALAWSPVPQADIRIIASFDEATGQLTPGRREVPPIGSIVLRPPRHLIKALLESRDSTVTEAGAGDVSLTIATARGYEGLELQIPPERLFGRHCAVVGSSGGGKSCTVARIIEECARYRSKVILLDPTGEYEPLEGPVFHVHIGEPTRDNVTSSSTTLPFYELTEADLVAILEPESSIQVAKLRAATRTLKLLHLEPRLSTEGVFAKAHREKLHYEQAFSDYKPEIDLPQNLFDLTKLPLQIELECVEPNRSNTETGFWGGVNTEELAVCSSFINRITDVLQREELDAIVDPPAGPSLFETIDSFLNDPDFSVLRVSLEFLPTIYNTREIVCNAIARRLLGVGRSGTLNRYPTLLVVDEAHQVVRKTTSRFAREYPLDAFNIIAKEGRKYGLSLCVATQRPNDIPDDVMSQIGTFIVHRLASDADRLAIERASGGCGPTLLAELPTLAAGEAYILGLDFGIPLEVSILMPRKRPRSHGPDYQRMWRPYAKNH